MSASRECPQTQDANEIFNAETWPKHVVKDELGGRSDEGEVGGLDLGQVLRSFLQIWCWSFKRRESDRCVTC